MGIKTASDEQRAPPGWVSGGWHRGDIARQLRVGLIRRLGGMPL